MDLDIIQGYDFFEAINCAFESLSSYLKSNPLSENKINQKMTAGGWTALHWATLYKFPQMIGLLVDHGANPYKKLKLDSMSCRYKVICSFILPHP